MRIKARLTSMMLVFLLLVDVITSPASAFAQSANYESFQDSLASKGRNVAGTSTYENYQLSWENSGLFGNLVSVDGPELCVQYEYDDYGHRTCKKTNNEVTSFSYANDGIMDGILVSKFRDGCTIHYNYSEVDGKIVPSFFPWMAIHFIMI